jgi:hypothetical protein
MKTSTTSQCCGCSVFCALCTSPHACRAPYIHSCIPNGSSLSHLSLSIAAYHYCRVSPPPLASVLFLPSPTSPPGRFRSKSEAKFEPLNFSFIERCVCHGGYAGVGEVIVLPMFGGNKWWW